MRKFLIVLLIVSFLFLGSPIANAQVAWPITAKTYTSTTANDLQDIYVYGITLLATSSNASAGIYDTTTDPGGVMTANRGEVGAATAYDSVTQPFTEPIKISNLTVRVHNGALTVFYKK